MVNIFHSSTSKYSLLRNFKCDEENAVIEIIPLKKLAIPIAIFLIFIILIISTRKQNAQKMWLEAKANEWMKYEKQSWIQKFSDSIEMGKREYEYYSQWLDYDPKLRIKPEFDRFIYSHVMGGGLGNQMYRFAALYAMGQLVNRTPIYYEEDEKMHEIDAELAKGFPNFYRRIYFLKQNANESEIETINGFERRCCDYADTRVLYGHEKRLLKINGRAANFQNSKYFHKIRPKIMELFEFGEQIVENMTKIIQKEFNEKLDYKICVHTRNGDFAGLGESRADQVGPAIDRIIRHLPSMTNGQFGNFSLVLFGEDKELLHSLKFDKNALKSTHFVADLKLGRIGELYFAQQICDLFLDTASLSSFAFWMGYLMPESKPKFFIRKYISNQGTNTFDQLPPEWFPIEEEWLKT